MEITGMDQIDNRIIELLRDNARLSYSEIGKIVGLSRVTVKRRIEQIEKSGIIKGYHAVIDPQAAVKGIRFTLDLDVVLIHYEEVVGKLAANPMIHQIYGTSGKSHIHAIGIVPNSETLGSYANYLFRSTRGVRELNWQILVTTYKDTERGVDYEIRYQKHEHMEAGSESGGQEQTRK